MQLKVSHPKTNREMIVEWNAPANLDDAVKMYGKEIVYNQAIAALKVAVQGIVRNAMGGEEPKTAKQIQQIVSEYKPGLRVRGKSPQEKIAETYAKMSKEEKAALIKRLSGATETK